MLAPKWFSGSGIQLSKPDNNHCQDSEQALINKAVALLFDLHLPLHFLELSEIHDVRNSDGGISTLD